MGEAATPGRLAGQPNLCPEPETLGLCPAAGRTPRQGPHTGARHPRPAVTGRLQNREGLTRARADPNPRAQPRPEGEVSSNEATRSPFEWPLCSVTRSPLSGAVFPRASRGVQPLLRTASHGVSAPRAPIPTPPLARRAAAGCPSRAAAGGPRGLGPAGPVASLPKRPQLPQARRLPETLAGVRTGRGPLRPSVAQSGGGLAAVSGERGQLSGARPEPRAARFCLPLAHTQESATFRLESARGTSSGPAQHGRARPGGPASPETLPATEPGSGLASRTCRPHRRCRR